MRRLLFPLLLLFLALACTSPSPKPYTRGIGIYPGDPAEDFSPGLVSGGAEHRNLALHRAASHSSSFDFNQTAQLVTDGLVTAGKAPWIALTVNGKSPGRIENNYLTDGNVSRLDVPGAESVFRLDFHGCPVTADRLVMAGGAAGATPSDGNSLLRVEGSEDGEHWIPLGSGKPVAADSPAGVNKLIMHPFEWIVPFGGPVTYPRYRLTLTVTGATALLPNEVYFYRDGQCLDLTTSRTFVSVWKSATGADEWIQVDLGAASAIDGMTFRWNNPPRSGRILVSKDGRRWKKAREIAAGEDFTTPSVKARARYVRAELDETADGEPFELSEWEIMGSGGVVPEPRPGASRQGARQPLAGGGWKLQRASLVEAAGEEIASDAFDDAAWMVATVPGTVLGSYVAAGAVPHPNFADNQLFISDSYFRSDWWYRDTFEAHPDTPRQFLHFEGINWKACIWLNGTWLGRVEGAFREACFDVTGLLKDGRNDLAVRIIHNEHYGMVKEQSVYTPDNNGGVLGADNPTMHATIGWDWIPTVRGRNIGIYGDVSLAYTGTVTLEDPFVRTELPLPDTTSAAILAEVTLCNHGDVPVEGVLEGRYGPLAFRRNETVPAGGRKKVVLDPMTLEHPSLWWPNGYGEPHLYPVEMRFETAEGLSDSTSFFSGVRQMDYRMEPYGGMDPELSKDIFGGRHPQQRLSLYINGRRLIGFGGNWGYPEHLLNYREREYDIAVGFHADMHFTMIRNWVGMTDSRAFYEACDRYGITVWQDFWLANPWDGPDPADPALFNAVASEYVRRIRNHPSIAIYVGRNEGYPPKEIDSHLSRLVAVEHPGLYYIPHSGTDGVSGGGPYRALPVKEYFRLYGHDRLHSERGMPCVMNEENLVRAMGEDAVDPVSTLAHPNRMYGLHDYTLGVEGSSAQWAESFNELLCAAFGEPADARTFAREAQWINYDGYRAMFEGRSECRRGLLLWMSHPAWPSMVWQTYDYYFEPTAAYFGCKKACEPLHVQFNSLKGTVEAVNYRARDRKGLTATARVLRMDGTQAGEQTCTFDIPEDSTVTCFPLEVPGDISDVYFIQLLLTDAEGTLLSRNFYWKGKEEGNLKALLDVPEARVSARVSGDGEDFDVRLSNTGRAPALMLRLKVTDSATGDLVLPVWYSDNYIFLMPGESREISVHVRKEDCGGAPVLSLEGFNLDNQRL